MSLIFPLSMNSFIYFKITGVYKHLGNGLLYAKQEGIYTLDWMLNKEFYGGPDLKSWDWDNELTTITPFNYE